MEGKDVEHEGDITVLKQLTNSAMAPWLYIGPGTMRGCYGGGKVTALEKYAKNKSLIHGFAGIVGVSTGVPTAAYAIANQAAEGTQHYYTTCCDRRFISFSRLLMGGHGADISYLIEQFRSSDKRLLQERVYASQTQLWFGMAEYDDVSERYLHAQSIKPDIIHGIHAAIAIPAMYRSPVYINGIRYNDGGAVCRPLRFIISKKPTGIIVFANSPRDYAETFSKKILTTSVMLLEPNARQRLVMQSRYERAAHDFQELRESGIPYFIVYTDREVGSYQRKPAVVKAAAERAHKYLYSLLERAGV